MPKMKFKCNQCGQCCSRIRGIIPEGDRKFIQEFAYGRLPLVQLIPIEKMTFPLYDWEAKRFLKWKGSIEADIKPLRAIFDLHKNRAIIVSYYIDADYCPFLKENKCAIYDKERAFVCRMFPFNKSPILKTGAESDREGLFGECPSVEEIKKNSPEDNELLPLFLRDAFGDNSFLNAMQNDIVTEWMNQTIMELIKKNIIRPALGYPYEYLMKRIANTDKIDFTDFLVREGVCSSDEMEKLIKRFDMNTDAIEKTLK